MGERRINVIIVIATLVLIVVAVVGFSVWYLDASEQENAENEGGLVQAD